MALTHQELVEYGRKGGFTVCAKRGAAEVGSTLNRAKMASYERRADPDGVLSPQARRERAEFLCRAQLAEARAARARKAQARRGRAA